MTQAQDDQELGGPLAGLRIIDMTTSYAGPSASMYLADLGADVIKVERPGGGDDARSWGPPFVDGNSAWFAAANRNKRSVVIDLASPDGLWALRTLVRSTDVFMENLTPGKLESLGLDHATLRSENPRLIYCALSGFGLDGSDSSQRGYDLVAQARSGIMSVTGARGGPPQRVSSALSDVITGMCAALAVSAAVVRQRATGMGDVIDVSLLDSDLAVMAPRIASHLAGEPEPAPSDGTDSVLAVYQRFPTADRDIVIAIGNDAMWRRFCAAAGLPDLAAEPELADNAGRREHRARLIKTITDALSGRDAEDWLGVLEAAGVPVSLVKGLSEVASDPHVRARNALMEVPGSGGGLFSVHSPFRLASIPAPRNERFPDLGADTAAVLAEYGFVQSEIDRLISNGAVHDTAARPEEDA